MTPFEQLRPAHQYADLEDALHHVAQVGVEIRHVGLPVGLRPIVAAFTGSGNVSRGAQEVYDRLSVLEIDPQGLSGLAEDRDQPRNVVFPHCPGPCRSLPAARRRRFRRRRIPRASRAYESALDDLLPHITLLMHGAYWEPGQPELVSRAQLARLLDSDPQPKLRVIGDITCDVGGAIAATVRATDPGDPVYLYDPRNPGAGASSGLAGSGFVVMAVDNLPCELPLDSSRHFGDSLARFVGALAHCDWDEPWESLDLPLELRGAILVHRGAPTPPYVVLHQHLAATGH